MRLPLYQFDAFASARFRGNPAAVVPLDTWLPEDLLQAIAAENNLSETAFFVPQDRAGGLYRLRWFTPTVEVALCGHATLATAAAIFRYLDPEREALSFETQSGRLSVTRRERGLALRLPLRPPQPWQGADAAVAAALAYEPRELRRAGMGLALLSDAAAVRALRPDLARVATLPSEGLIVTAPGEDCDFVSRYFAPQVGIPEDPVTGSAHCLLAPYWSERLGKRELFARQVSARGGELWCRLEKDEVEISGQVVPYLEGTIEV